MFKPMTAPKTLLLCSMLGLLVCTGTVSAQIQPKPPNNCICGAQRDTIFKALTTGRLLQYAYNDLKSKHDSTGRILASATDSISTLNRQQLKTVKRAEKAEKSRNGWRLLSVVLAGLAAVSFL